MYNGGGDRKAGGDAAAAVVVVHQCSPASVTVSKKNPSVGEDPAPPAITAEKRAAASLNLPCVLIIVVASVERFAYKGVASNLVTYLTGVVGMSTAAAAKSVSAWSGVTSMLPLVSAVLADSYWDRYSTVTASSVLYVLGLVGLASWALLRTWLPRSTLLLTLYLISIGQAGYNPALQAFGADQLGIGDDDENTATAVTGTEEKGKVKSKFFQWWYFGICSGSLLGNSIMSYIQDNLGWGLGFAVPSAVMAMSVAAFFCCTPLYVQKQPGVSIGRPSPISVFKVVKSMLANVGAPKIKLPSRVDDGDDAVSELELQEKPLKAASHDQTDSLDDEVMRAPSVAKIILGLLPIWAMLLMFAVIFQQPMTFFTKQGTLMDHTVGGTFVIPPAMLQSSITVSIILLMPMYDRMISMVTRSGDGITVLQRIGVGIALSVVAMGTAALVESWRLRATSRPSIFWLLPQYVLLGVSDVFTVVGMQEFFYTQVPATMRTVGIALYQSIFGVGSFLNAFLIAALEMATATDSDRHGWFSNDPREARLDKFYWFLALMSAISFVIFLHLCKCYQSTDSAGK